MKTLLIIALLFAAPVKPQHVAPDRVQTPSGPVFRCPAGYTMAIGTLDSKGNLQWDKAPGDVDAMAADSGRVMLRCWDTNAQPKWVKR